VVLYFKLKRRVQATFLVWENVYLVSAKTRDSARRRAEALGRAECDANDSLTVNGEPAALVFGGIRKLVSCAADPDALGSERSSSVAVLQDGVEATYSTFLVRGARRLKTLIQGKPTAVKYEE
jgi:hypothetical protein